MYVPGDFVNEHREEIEREAHRLHKLREVLAKDYDTPHDNFITACSHVFVRYISAGKVRPC